MRFEVSLLLGSLLDSVAVARHGHAGFFHAKSIVELQSSV